MLVLAPLRVIGTSWPQQLDYWKDFEHLTYVTVHGGAEARRAALNTPADVYLMNVEGLIGKEWASVGGAPNPIALRWLHGKKVMLVVDESTKFKNPTARRSKSLKSYLPYFSRKVILTGTPRPGKLEDLFFQCYITDSGADLGKYISHFRNQYMMPDPSGFGYREQMGAAERVAKKIAPTTLQIQTEEAVPVQTVPIWLPMPPHLRDQYNELKREFLLQLGDKTVLAPSAGVLYGKLRQFAQGAIFDTLDEDGSWITLHESKLDALENLLEELNGEPAFCLYQYRHDYERINQRLGEVVPRVGGGIGAALGAAHCRAFSAGAMRLLLGHPASVAHGVDGLQSNCHNVIWFGGDPSWENYYQANQRIVRHGTKADQVFIYHIMLDCAIERSILATVTGKRDDEGRFLSLLRDELYNE